MGTRKRGSYFGTEIGRIWWKRFRGDKMFARGNGELWLDEDGLSFHRKLTKSPIQIRWEEITGARLGKWHSGRWGAGRPILKVDFRRHGMELSAGFLLSSSWPEMETFAKDLRRKVGAAGA